jgi:hypothetical protein
MKSTDSRQHWLTAVSDCSSLAFIELTCRRNLELVVDGGELGRVEKFRFVWKEFFSYKVTLEEHGVPWPCSTQDTKWGCTNKVLNSSWLASLKDGDGYVDLLHPDAEHFVVITSDYVIEVISNQDPEIQPCFVE